MFYFVIRKIFLKSDAWFLPHTCWTDGTESGKVSPKPTVTGVSRLKADLATARSLDEQLSDKDALIETLKQEIARLTAISGGSSGKGMSGVK